MIRLIKPSISYKEVEEDFKKVFESGIFTKGEYVTKFVDKIKEYTGVKHVFLTTSATTALSMSLKLLNIGKGDEVIISDFSFPATVNVVEDLGARPIFADVSKETFNMDPKELEKKVSKNTKAVIFVDALGNPSGILKIKSICQKYNIPLIQDSACSIGSCKNNLKVGNIADLTCFSFHPRKMVTTGEGGAITTNNAKYAEILEVKLNHGAKLVAGKLDYITYGYNYRLPDLQAIMGIIQLNKLNRIINQRIKIRDYYESRLIPLNFKKQKIESDVIHNVQSLVFIVPPKISRDKLIEYLRQNNIEATIGTYCLSNTTYYSDKYKEVQPNAKFLEENTITLPCYEGVNSAYICDVISTFISNG